MKELRARWNGVTGHELTPPDLGQVLPEAAQRAKHLALKAIVDFDVDNEERNDTLDE